MPSLTRRLCSGCKTITSGPCPTCTKTQRRDTDTQRGNSNSRGYGSRWRRSIRPAFLRANPLCALCGALATVPDHWPDTRATLIAQGATDPDAEHRLRPLCRTCHDQHGLRGPNPA